MPRTRAEPNLSGEWCRTASGENSCPSYMANGTSSVSFGKPVEVCYDVNEPLVDNTFLPVNAIANRAIYSIDEVSSERSINRNSAS